MKCHIGCCIGENVENTFMRFRSIRLYFFFLIIFFTDDSLIFCKGFWLKIQKVKEFLCIYELASGKIMNYSKSIVLFSSNINVYDKEAIQQELGFYSDLSFSRYLDLPTIFGKDKMRQLRYILDKVYDKIQSYRANYCLSLWKKFSLRL